MIPNKFDIARVTITFTTPMLVSTGAGDDVNDAICVRDAHGLPSIPGTSIAGALRHRLHAQDKEKAKSVFGYTEGKDSKRSLITISWGVVHDATDTPVSGDPLSKPDDEVLSFLQQGVHRDHVRISEYGVAEDRGKFDELLVPTGARFTCSIVLDKEANISIEKILGILHSSSFRLGGRTRNGFGAFEVSSVQQASYDLQKNEDFENFKKFSFDSSKPWDVPKKTYNGALKNSEDIQEYVLRLRAKDFLLPSGGVGLEEVFGSEGAYSHADIFPVYEHKVVWSNGSGSVSPKPHFFLPSTSIKGALRHRTLFYTNVLLGLWSNSAEVQEVRTERKRNKNTSHTTKAEELVNQLFGMAKNEKQVPGVVMISEPNFSPDTQHRVFQHVALDRFTQAPLQGALFGEVVLALRDQPFEIRITLNKKMLESRENIDEEQRGIVIKALNLACRDLRKGRLAMGGGASRGHGRVEEIGEQQDFSGFTA